jgi:mono/diheme cytochrome c family protein
MLVGACACAGALGLAVACGNPPAPETPSAPAEQAPAAQEAAVHAAPGQAEGPKRIPHEVVGKENCTSCHTLAGSVSGEPKAEAMPADHQGRDNGTCQGCHTLAK